MITPHINAKHNDFSELVILSGDPLRVEYIAKNFLKNIVQVTNVRSMLGFTGYYKNYKISIMSHGMGIPSSAIYIEELIKFYNVKKIIRVGTCGTIQKNINLKDIIIAMGACTDSNFNRIRFNNYDFSAIANFKMIYNTINIAKLKNLDIKVGNFFTTDSFYFFDNNIYTLLEKYNILGIDMETAGIYNISAFLKVKSMSICFVSDHLKYNTKLSIQDRQNSFMNVIQLALETIIL